MNEQVSGEVKPTEAIIVEAVRPGRSRLRDMGVWLAVFVGAAAFYMVFLRHGNASSAQAPVRHASGASPLLITLALQGLPLLLVGGLWIVALRRRGRPGMRRLSAPIVATAVMAILGTVMIAVLAYGKDLETLKHMALSAGPVLLIAVVYLFFLWRSGRTQGGARSNQVTYSVEDEGFTLKTQDASLTVKWAVITAVEEQGDYWVVRGPASYAMPRRFFGDRAQEKVFVARVLEKLTPPARTASRAAERFAADT